MTPSALPVLASGLPNGNRSVQKSGAAVGCGKLALVEGRFDFVLNFRLTLMLHRRLTRDP